MEVFTMNPGEYIELKVPSTLTPKNMLLNLANTELSKWAEITLTHSDGTQTQVTGESENEWLVFDKKHLPTKPITAVRLTHKGNTAQEVKLTYFRLELPAEQAEVNPALLIDGDLTTFYSNGKGDMQLNMTLSPNTKKIIVVGTAACTLNGAQPTATTEFTQEFAVPTDSNRVKLEAPQQTGKYTFEVIFVHNNN